MICENVLVTTIENKLTLPWQRCLQTATFQNNLWECTTTENKLTLPWWRCSQTATFPNGLWECTTIQNNLETATFKNDLWAYTTIKTHLPCHGGGAHREQHCESTQGCPSNLPETWIRHNINNAHKTAFGQKHTIPTHCYKAHIMNTALSIFDTECHHQYTITLLQNNEINEIVDNQNKFQREKNVKLYHSWLIYLLYCGWSVYSFFFFWFCLFVLSNCLVTCLQQQK